MSTRRHRSRIRRSAPNGSAPLLTSTTATRAVLANVAALRRDRALELCDLTAAEADRRHLEEARPLLELAVVIDRRYGGCDLRGRAALAAAVRVAGPCPAGWCRYPAGHTGDHEPLEAA